jgi:hypothetical protein
VSWGIFCRLLGRERSTSDPKSTCLATTATTRATRDSVLNMLYGIVCLVLLNLLIAIMGSAHRAVEDRSFQEWLFYRAKVLNNFKSVAIAQPPPFNLVIGIFDVFEAVWRRLCCGVRMSAAKIVFRKRRHVFTFNGYLLPHWDVRPDSSARLPFKGLIALTFFCLSIWLPCAAVLLALAILYLPFYLMAGLCWNMHRLCTRRAQTTNRARELWSRLARYVSSTKEREEGSELGGLHVSLLNIAMHPDWPSVRRFLRSECVRLRELERYVS